jgi:hypothetical protein
MYDKQRKLIDKELQELKELKLVTNLLSLNREELISGPSTTSLESRYFLEKTKEQVPNLVLTDQSNYFGNTSKSFKTSSGENDKQAVFEPNLVDCDATINDSSELTSDYSSYEDAVESISNFSWDSIFDWECFFDSSIELNYINPPVTPPNTPTELFNNIIIKLNLNLNISRQ